MEIKTCLVILWTVVSLSAAATNLTVASSTDEYFAAWQRQYQNNIKEAELKISSMDSLGANTIQAMKDREEEMVREIERNIESLIPLQVLSPARRHCIQTHEALFITVKEAQTRSSGCIYSAQLRVNTLTSSSKSFLTASKNIIDNLLPKAVENCNKAGSGNQTKTEQCVISNVQSYGNQIENNLRNLEKSLDASSCTSTDLSRDAMKCWFGWEKSILVTMGKVNTMIDTCVQEAETECSCAKRILIESETIIKKLIN